MADFLESLNEEQRNAVKVVKDGGAVLILAGAGTGKTTTLIAAIFTIFPDTWMDILAVTFTNKAANELKSRIFQKTGKSPYWCGTFHSVCLKILRKEKQNLGLRSDFLVFGEDDQKKVLKSVFTEMKLESKDYDPGNWIEAISFYKDTGRKKNQSDKFDEILHKYNEELKRLNALDFADIINHTNDLFNERPAVLKHYQDKFKYILVDEYQDTNVPQHTLLKKLADGHKNICCVGDDDQSIYSWRGAHYANILNFEKDFPGAKIFRLTQNYRSTGHILNAANSLIKNNIDRHGNKDLWSGLGDGRKVKIVRFYSDLEECSAIVSAIENDESTKKSATAILIRNGSLSRKFEEEFIQRRIPYKLVGAQKFYDRMEIQDTIAYLRLLVHRFDDMAFLRIIAKPRRGLGDKVIDELKLHSLRTGKTLFEALREISLKPKQRDAAKEFINAFNFDFAAMPPAVAALKLIETCGYVKMWRESKDDNAEDRIKNIYELINSTISKYSSMEEFLENASLMVADDGADFQPDEEKDAVNIMTIHAAKGLEFQNVFLPAWENGIFPKERAADDSLEEERRLAYVAITRAKRNCAISYTASRFLFGQKQNNSPSIFIDEIDDKFVEKVGFGYQHNSPPRWRGGGEAARVVERKQETPTLFGKLVSHTELGKGVVIELSGDTATIAFRDAGIKKVKIEFLEIAKE
ncbi:MAG: UvrD-helicase domain-containing protein [Rickettsiales bacterium]|jgi:DNA helicase-2/ATP-dependent DNA helicase PcrA|nr:UvrD-helicase domain-containing protein [Rickettsiales bacterium]